MPATPSFFHTPSQKGRRITAVFTYMQRIGKKAGTQVSFPYATEESFPEAIEWAAIRQFEILQEADNLAIDDLDMTDIKRTFSALGRMRGGGYSVTIVTLGTYSHQKETDELALLDRRLQEEIAQMIHFLYLDELSDQATKILHKEMQAPVWNWTATLPHVAEALGVKHLFKPERETQAERVFFWLLEKLGPRHILHETAVGLALPESTKEKNWTYCAALENRFLAFQHTINTLFQNTGEPLASMRHMRGYGDRQPWRLTA